MFHGLPDRVAIFVERHASPLDAYVDRLVCDDSKTGRAKIRQQAYADIATIINSLYLLEMQGCVSACHDGHDAWKKVVTGKFRAANQKFLDSYRGGKSKVWELGYGDLWEQMKKAEAFLSQPAIYEALPTAFSVIREKCGRLYHIAPTIGDVLGDLQVKRDLLQPAYRPAVRSSFVDARQENVGMVRKAIRAAANVISPSLNAATI